jgi:4-aminobutyrate aminotransferase/(S)-3-amino-2-methylpropionate transaminase
MNDREKYVSKAHYSATPFYLERAEGSLLYDTEGHSYIDFASGISAANAGHSQKAVVEAVKAQAEKYMHNCFSVTMYEPYVRIAKRLHELTGLQKTLLVNSGAEAVENAIKVARHYTKKKNVISFMNSFHGRTYFTMALTGKMMPYKRGFGPFLGVTHSPYAYCYRCLFSQEPQNCNFECFLFLERLFDTTLDKEDTACLIVEPIQGEGGFVVPPKEFLHKLQKFCRESGMVFIVDEIQTGLGRTGEMFAFQHFDIQPDLLTLGKSLGGGLPLASVSGSADMMDCVQEGGLGGTFGGNPISCVAGLESLKIIEENLPNARKIGAYIGKRFSEMVQRFEIIGEVRGVGAMQAVELVRDRKTKEPAREELKKILAYCHSHGLVILSAGLFGNVIRTLPPITTSIELAEKAMDIVEEGFRNC